MNMETYGFTPMELRVLRSLKTPAKVQDFVDSLSYEHKNSYHSPKTILKRRSADCFTAALFAAAALRVNGYESLVVDLEAERDEDHVLAVFKTDGKWGAVAKSKFAGLKYREPLFGSIRELAQSYFEHYYNYARQKTLRRYSRPINLKRFDKNNWMTTKDESIIESIEEYLDSVPHFRIISRKMEKKLRTVDKFSFARGIIERKKS